MREWLLNFFRDLETAVPPDKGCHHALLRMHYGAGESWDERLALRLGVGAGPVYFLDEADMQRQTLEIAREVERLEAVRRSAAPVWRGHAESCATNRREFDCDCGADAEYERAIAERDAGSQPAGGREKHMRAEIGQAVTFVDTHRMERPAVVTQVWRGPEGMPDGVNLVYVSGDEAKGDTYGRQIERATSVPHASTQPANGYCWK